MNILRLYLRLPPERGGMENHIKRLTEEQLSMGHRVTLAFNQGHKVSDTDCQILKSIPLLNFPFGTGIFLFHIMMLARLVFRPSKYDFCHLHGDWHALLFAPAYRFITGGKIAFSFHGAYEPTFITHRYILTRILRMADLVLVNGTESLNYLKPFHNFIHLRSSGVEDFFFNVAPSERPPEAAFKIITIANLNLVKNLDTLIRIAAKAPAYTFYIYGEGAQRSALAQKIHELKLQNVILAGYRSRAELAAELSTADVFLLTSLKEGTPTVVLEAMAAKVPVVASNAGGLSDFLQPDIAYIVQDPFDVQKYLEALILLHNNKKIREQRIEKAHIFSQLFSWRNVAVSITDYMNEITRK